MNEEKFDVTKYRIAAIDNDDEEKAHQVELLADEADLVFHLSVVMRDWVKLRPEATASELATLKTISAVLASVLKAYMDDDQLAIEEPLGMARRFSREELVLWIAGTAARHAKAVEPGQVEEWRRLIVEEAGKDGN
jgi:hypothetical protein